VAGQLTDGQQPVRHLDFIRHLTSSVLEGVDCGLCRPGQ
jgi:hypothetical protein